MLTLGIITTPIFLYGATYFAPVITNLAKSTGAVHVNPGQQLSWSTFEGPDFRLFFAQAFNGKWWAIAAALVWLLIFIWLYKDQNKIALPSKRYALNTGTVDNVENVSEATDITKGNDTWSVSSIDGMNFENVHKHIISASTKDKFSINDINDVDFSNFTR